MISRGSDLLQTFDFTADDLVDEGEIGRGAYGTVNRMVHSRSGTVMAVKVYVNCHSVFCMLPKICLQVFLGLFNLLNFFMHIVHGSGFTNGFLVCH